MSATDDREQIGFMMREFLRAFRERDTETLNQMMADDFTFSDPGGPVISKQQWLSDIENGELIFDSIEASQPEFKYLGDQVLVLGQATLQARYTKGDYTGTFRYMGVYTRQNGKWKLELTSATREDSVAADA